MTRLGAIGYARRLERLAEADTVLGASPRPASGARCTHREDLGEGHTVSCLNVVALSVEGRPLCRMHASEALDWSLS